MEGVLGYIALGTNLGDRAGNLRAALHGFRLADGLDVQRWSPVYESAAHTKDPAARPPDYLNAVVEVVTALTPAAVLSLCQRLEREAGRTRQQSWDPRTLDLDLLTLGSHRSAGPRLQLPHPRLADRRFVLQPWADLAPHHFVGCPFYATVSELLTRCTDTGTLHAMPLAWEQPDL